MLYQLTDIQQSYKNKTVLQIARLSIQAGEIFALVGPSGAGKSTLLRLLAFLEQPSYGQIFYKGRRCEGKWPNLSERRHVTMVFQNPRLLNRSVFENVTYGLKIRKQQNIKKTVMEILQNLGLDKLINAMAHSLSGGEAQRVALARALVLKPDVLLLDEPTANLDPYNIKLIESFVQQENRDRGTTIIIVTHNVFQAKRLADRTALLLTGRLVEVSKTETFFEQPQQAETAAFIRGDIIY